MQLLAVPEEIWSHLKVLLKYDSEGCILQKKGFSTLVGQDFRKTISD